jgi:hypothetical protein
MGRSGQEKEMGTGGRGAGIKMAREVEGGEQN